MEGSRLCGENTWSSFLFPVTLVTSPAASMTSLSLSSSSFAQDALRRAETECDLRLATLTRGAHACASADVIASGGLALSRELCY